MSTALVKRIRGARLFKTAGQVTRCFGLLIEANGPDVFLGERCVIGGDDSREALRAEVIGLRDGRVLLMPLGDIRGVRAGCEVIGTKELVQVPVGQQLLGRVIDAFGTPLDEGPPLGTQNCYPLVGQPFNPLRRRPIDTVLETGVKAIDTLLTIGRGQRVGIFAGSGVGKSTLLGMVARSVTADVNVIALIGERGREVLEFIRKNLGDTGLARSVVVAATSDQPALMRVHAAHAATAIAEYFRDQGLNVLLTMDSVTRFAMAQREIGLAVGEPPTARGYTPSVFAALPRLLERGGIIGKSGSITALYTVLVEADDMNDPVADHVRAIVDGHVVLSRKLAHEGHYPSIDVLQSNSRLANDLRREEETELTRDLVHLLSVYRESKDMLDLGAYQSGANPQLDRALRLMPKLKQFLIQKDREVVHRKQAFASLQAILSEPQRS